MADDKGLAAERWKTVCGGNYEISDHGNFRRSTPGRRTHPGRMFTPIKMKIGYFMVQPTINGKNVKFYIHRLVAEAFIGPAPKRHDVNHKDGNKTNNHVSNLEYVTHGDNMRHAFRTGLVQARRTHPTETINRVRELRAAGMSYSKISRETGVTIGWCWMVINGGKRNAG